MNYKVVMTGDAEADLDAFIEYLLSHQPPLQVVV